MGGKREKGKGEKRGHPKSQGQSGPAAGFRVPGMETRPRVQKRSDLQLRTREIISRGRKQNDLKRNLA